MPTFFLCSDSMTPSIEATSMPQRDFLPRIRETTAGKLGVQAFERSSRISKAPSPMSDWLCSISVVEGEWVVVRCTFSGTHRGVGRIAVNGGMLVGVPPTGRHFEVQHIHMYKVPNGEIVEHFANRDDFGMMQQLGLLQGGI
jgi:predicted ester cyclase